ncbi:MAG: hypothetical protein GXP31_16400 [Kiritimatiellaeota bacterium]|nr:hypothetical protein [Kiritimatiellota bacterium]
MRIAVEEQVVLPRDGTAVALELPRDLQALRLKALRPESDAPPNCSPPALPLIDARAWVARTHGEDWLLWRARRTAERLARLPIEILPGERLVGRPVLGAPTPEQRAAIEKVRTILQSIPPFPGGDAGHFHPAYERTFELGLGGLQAWVRRLRAQYAHTSAKHTFYSACATSLQAVSTYAVRTAEACDDAAARGLPGNWEHNARICRKIATAPPETFHEALQLMFLLIIALWFGENHSLTSPGRMDQTLHRFYEADIAAGRLTPQTALELLAALYIQLNMILGPGSALAVMVGGRDAKGAPVANDLTYLCLAARLATRLVYPTVGLAWHDELPDELTNFAMGVLAAGLGDPAFFNDDLIQQGLMDNGVRAEDAWNYVNSTCVEIKVAGASNIWVTQPYFNCPRALLEEMQAVADGAVPTPDSFAEFEARVRARIAEWVRQEAARLDRIWRQRAETGCFPLASCFVADCLETGKDFDRGGARYNWVENSFVGLANLVDGLLAVQELVFERGDLSLQALWEALDRDYAGHEGLRQRIIKRLPKYGNDHPAADDLAVRWADFLQRITGAQRVGPHAYVPGFFCWVVHERFGRETGATPDGRGAGLALADGAGAAQGRETRGPTAAILSTTKWSHRAALGGLVQNLKVSRTHLHNRAGRTALRALIETYLHRGGFEIQINAVDAQDLIEAQQHPENYRDLLVRVAGYSDYFVHLNRNMQNEIIARTLHEEI